MIYKSFIESNMVMVFADIKETKTHNSEITSETFTSNSY